MGQGTAGRLMSAPAVVLLYHRINRAAHDPHMLQVRPGNFADHLDVAGRLAELVDLGAVVRPSKRPRVAITFDDGYADNLEQGVPVLERAGCPATVFVSSDYVGTTRRFWWDRLSDLLRLEAVAAPSVSLDVGGSRLWADVRSAAARQRLHDALHPRLRLLPVATAEACLDDIFEQLGAPSGLVDDRILTEAQVRELSKGSATVGAHTCSHPVLAELPFRRQRSEVASSRRALEAMTGGVVDRFAYPFGNPGSFTQLSEVAVRLAGFRQACWNSPGTIGERTNPLRIPRHLVRDWPASEFERHLRSWLHA
jgi:peptidoglycan/xylan/chitin deacetylase (PgdA/CDA1 family)